MCHPGKPPTPRRVPLLLALHAGRGQLPEGEVGRVALGLDVLDPTGRLQVVEAEVGELGVAGEGADVEVHAVVDDVGVALGLEGLHHGDLLGDVVGGPRQDVGLEAAQATSVVGPLLRVAGRDVGRRLAGGGGRLLHLVVALVGVGDEVADVGDVGDEGDLVARPRSAPGAGGPGTAGGACCRGAGARRPSDRTCRCRPCPRPAARRAGSHGCGCRGGGSPPAPAGRPRRSSPDHGRSTPGPLSASALVGEGDQLAGGHAGHGADVAGHVGLVGVAEVGGHLSDGGRARPEPLARLVQPAPLDQPARREPEPSTGEALEGPLRQVGRDAQGRHVDDGRVGPRPGRPPG